MPTATAKLIDEPDNLRKADLTPTMIQELNKIIDKPIKEHRQGKGWKPQKNELPAQVKEVIGKDKTN